MIHDAAVVDEPVTISDYAPLWPAVFESERIRVTRALGDSVADRTHRQHCCPGDGGKADHRPFGWWAWIWQKLCARYMRSLCGATFSYCFAGMAKSAFTPCAPGQRCVTVFRRV